MDIYEAVADHVRRSILEKLNRQPCSAGEIADVFPISRPAVSRHLRVLREAGLVTAVPHGRQQVYQIERNRLAEIDSWLEQFRHSSQGFLDALETEVYRTRRERTTGSGSISIEEEDIA